MYGCLFRVVSDGVLRNLCLAFESGWPPIHLRIYARHGSNSQPLRVASYELYH